MKETVGIGFIGTGFARRVQIPAFLGCKGARAVSVSSANLANARSTAEEFSIEHYSNDWRETISRKDVDLVCITTPPNLHKEMVLAALEVGKHVLAEKPMAMNCDEAVEMSEAAKSTGVLSLIDHELRFLPGRQKGFELLRDGSIGKVRHVKYSFRSPNRSDPGFPWDWWSDSAAGGGTLGAINSHIIDSFNWFLGSEIASIYCQLHTHVKKRLFKGGLRDVTTDDEANMLLRFGDGELTEDATGLASVSMIEGPEYMNRIEFFGTRGAMRIDHRGDVYLAERGEADWRALEVDYPPGIEGLFESGFPSGFMAFAPKIVEAIRTESIGIPNAATFDDGVKVQRVLDAARESNQTGRLINLFPGTLDHT